MSRRVLLALGSNLGDRREHLRGALATMEGVTAVSRVFETEPVGGPEGQGPYLNLVVAVDTGATPRQLLALCQRLEAQAGRVRDERWGPRTLDVDVLWIDGETVHEPDLEIPHPRMRERRFVMAPLADVAPDLLEDGWEDRATGEVTVVDPL